MLESVRQLQTILIHNIILQIDIHCQSVSDKLSDKLQNKFIILYLSAIKLTCQSVSISVRQCQTSCRTSLLYYIYLQLN